MLAALPAYAYAAPAQQAEPSPLIKVGEHRMAHARQGAACAVLGPRLFIFGGAAILEGPVPGRQLVVRDGEVQMRRSFETVPRARAGVIEIETLDTSDGRVSPAPGTLLVRRFHAAIEHQGKFFLFGGQCDALGPAQVERRVEIYDPASGQVTFGPDMPEPRWGMAVVKLGSKAYLIGGSKHVAGDIAAQTNRVDVLDLDALVWSAGLPMPTPREAQAAVVGEFILVVGGYRSRKALAAVEMFVPQENRWKALPSLARPISAHALALLGDRLYSFGSYERLGTEVAYNLRTRETESLRTGFVGVRHACATVVGDRLYVIGGNIGRGLGTESDLIQVFARNPDFTQP